MSLDLIIGWQSFETEFRGETIKMEVRPFKRKAMLAVLPYLSKKMPDIKDNMTEDEITDLADKGFELQGLASDLLPDHLRKIQGITLNGRPLSFDDLADEPMFLPLTLAIITEIASISSIDQADAKNSEGLSDSMEEQAETDQ